MQASSCLEFRETELWADRSLRVGITFKCDDSGWHELEWLRAARLNVGLLTKHEFGLAKLERTRRVCKHRAHDV